MIDYIILEEDLTYLEKYSKVIEQVMMNYDLEYQTTVISEFNNINKKFFHTDFFKIYIIDNKSQSNSQHMIEYIREELDDWQSLIIMTQENKKDNINHRNFFILDTIMKNSHLECQLKRDIQICLKNYDQRPNSLKYTYKKINYILEYRNIIYIEKEQDNKRCIIKTNNNKYYIQGNLKTIKKLLDNRFFQSSRSFIINLEQVEKYDTKNNIIYFKNKQKKDVLSRNNKKDFIRMIRV